MKHTKGEWIIENVDSEMNLVYMKINSEDKSIGYVGFAGVYGGTRHKCISKEEAEANAKLIAEAGTVSNECNLTPRQLLDQRNELLEAAKALIAEFKGIRINDTTAQRFEKLILLEQVIARL